MVVAITNKNVFHLKRTPMLKKYWTSNKSFGNATKHTCIVSKRKKNERMECLIGLRFTSEDWKLIVQKS
jgi:hypothetical protein